MENRTIFLPRKAAEKLMEQAARDVKASSGGGTSPAPFISEGDILTTWCSKLACLGLSPKSNRPVSMINTVDVRSRIKNVFDPAAAYVQNLVFPCWVLSSVREIVSKPLGNLALVVRTALESQMTDGQARAIVREQRARAASGSHLMVGTPSSLLMPFSNWSKAKFFDVVDFAPAVVKSPKPVQERLNAAGRPVYHHAAGLTPNPMLRNVLNILGKDPQGNYWINALLPPRAWAKVPGELRSLSSEL